MTATEVVRSPAQELAGRIRAEAFRSQVAAALPEGIRPERFVRVAATAILNNPAIAKCDDGSVFRAVLRCAADGLLPDGREAAIVPFKDDATYIPMIGGLRKVAGESGWLLDAHLIYANDRFSWSPAPESIIHAPPPFGQERGEIIGAYAFATHMATGRRIYDEPMTKSDIEKVRSVSKVGTKAGTPWVEWYGEMAKKTAARRCFKKIPLTDLTEVGERIVATVDADIELDPSGYEEIAAATDLPPVDPAALDAEDAGGRPQAASASLAELEAVEITEGDHAGKTLKQVAEGPRGKHWLEWCAGAVDHPQCPEAAAYLEALDAS